MNHELEHTPHSEISAEQTLSDQMHMLRATTEVFSNSAANLPSPAQDDMISTLKADGYKEPTDPNYTVTFPEESNQRRIAFMLFLEAHLGTALLQQDLLSTFVSQKSGLPALDKLLGLQRIDFKDAGFTVSDVTFANEYKTAGHPGAFSVTAKIKSGSGTVTSVQLLLDFERKSQKKTALNVLVLSSPGAEELQTYVQTVSPFTDKRIQDFFHGVYHDIQPDALTFPQGGSEVLAVEYTRLLDAVRGKTNVTSLEQHDFTRPGVQFSIPYELRTDSARMFLDTLVQQLAVRAGLSPETAAQAVFTTVIQEQVGTILKQTTEYVRGACLFSVLELDESFLTPTQQERYKKADRTVAAVTLQLQEFAPNGMLQQVNKYVVSVGIKESEPERAIPIVLAQYTNTEQIKRVQQANDRKLYQAELQPLYKQMVENSGMVEFPVPDEETAHDLLECAGMFLQEGFSNNEKPLRTTALKPDVLLPSPLDELPYRFKDKPVYRTRMQNMTEIGEVRVKASFILHENGNREVRFERRYAVGEKTPDRASEKVFYPLGSVTDTVGITAAVQTENGAPIAQVKREAVTRSVHLENKIIDVLELQSALRDAENNRAIKNPFAGGIPGSGKNS